ncbi:response regulator transcription factor [Enterococcus hulanensis]|uniref:response regulator transcription factor n=1 Tax=Enterococcus hulanensis TaxID=2559929 RepID=UPI0010F442BE|nr:response regulator transcription factor [Enterococcus hulanensis]
MKKIFLVEDDENLRRGISFALEQEDYQVIAIEKVVGTVEIIQEEQPDLIILDINLPDGNGIDLCLDIRKITSTPIFFLTALDMEMDVVAGLSVGADDYITKPFSLAILKAKIISILRRIDTYTTEISQPPFILNLDANCLTKDGEEILLSSTEYRLVHYLIRNAGIVLEKEKLIDALWDAQGKFIDENTLFVNIRRIRLKIEADPQNPKFIQTIRGVGYVWNKRGRL